MSPDNLHHRKPEIAIVGGGPAGMAAALGAWQAGARDILIIEREDSLGGILNQCIHNGFGLHKFDQELTGPEYAGRYERLLRDTGVQTMTSTMVVDLQANGNITAVNAAGVWKIQPKATVLAMGCRERTRGALATPGTRPAGVMTAGTAQKFVNMDGLLPGENVVILGSGDIGLIMARRMHLEGAKVQAVVELLPSPSGLPRNIIQCLNDFSIPLLLSHTVVRIRGEKHLEGVTIARVDQHHVPIPDSETDIACDTLLLSVGLIPENELSRSAGIELDTLTGGPSANELFQTSRQNIFACGNVLHVHDLADYVSNESELAGRNAAIFARGGHTEYAGIPVTSGSDARHRAASGIDLTSVIMKMVCTVCPMGCHLEVTQCGDTFTVAGNECAKGAEFALSEMNNPVRTVTATVRIEGAEIAMLPVKTASPVAKDAMERIVKALQAIEVIAPVESGEVVAHNICGIGIDVVATRSLYRM